jgi:hypothetical protein
VIFRETGELEGFFPEYFQFPLPVISPPNANHRSWFTGPLQAAMAIGFSCYITPTNNKICDTKLLRVIKKLSG